MHQPKLKRYVLTEEQTCLMHVPHSEQAVETALSCCEQRPCHVHTAFCGTVGQALIQTHEYFGYLIA